MNTVDFKAGVNAVISLARFSDTPLFGKDDYDAVDVVGDDCWVGAEFDTLLNAKVSVPLPHGFGVSFEANTTSAFATYQLVPNAVAPNEKLGAALSGALSAYKIMATAEEVMRIPAGLIYTSDLTGWQCRKHEALWFVRVERMGASRPALFRRRHFREEIIVLCLRWYLRYPLSYRNLEEMMAERGLSVDHSTIARWVLHFAPLLSERIRRHLQNPNRSWRVDETYVRVAGRWTYLYRAIDSAGNTIDFRLSLKRDYAAAKTFLRLALRRAETNRPRVINVDGHPAYPRVINELKRTGELGRHCRCRPSRYLNNIIEQDHRFVKKRVVASQWFRSLAGAQNTIAGYEAMNMIRKGQIRWLAKDNIVGQAMFVGRALGIAA